MLVATTATPLAHPHARGDHTPGEVTRARELSATTVLVAAFGDVDAASADKLAEGIERHLSGYRQLVLDLSRLEFFGTAGYSVLHRVHSRCARAGVEWVLVPGPEVRRLLRVCDPDGMLPSAPNIVSAVAVLMRSHNRLSS